MVSSAKMSAYMALPGHGVGIGPSANANVGLGDKRMNTIGQSFGDVGEYIDDSPQVIAGVVLGALVTLVALKALGFKFVIGVGN